MFFGFFRRIYRKLCFCMLLVALVVFLKSYYPDFGQQIGRWVTGLENTKVAQSFSEMISGFAKGEGISRMVEVFREGLQG